MNEEQFAQWINQAPDAFDSLCRMTDEAHTEGNHSKADAITRLALDLQDMLWSTLGDDLPVWMKPQPAPQEQHHATD